MENYERSACSRSRYQRKYYYLYRNMINILHISAHILRHTTCTRMAETDLDIKAVQYVMGHANISVTMDVYNHVTYQERIVREIAKLDEVRVM